MLSVVLSASVVMAAPSSAGTPGPDPSVSTTVLPPVCGTWALAPVNSARHLQHSAPTISTALRTPYVRGLSVRAPWHAVDADLSLFDAAYRQSRAAGKPISVRFMAGRHTPARVFAAGAHYYVDSAGDRVPVPFSRTGAPGNPVFEAAYDRAVARMAAWSRAHGARVLHLPWYGHKWAEIDNGREVTRARGYSYPAWLAGHKRLVDIGLRYAGTDLSIEFAMSGHWGSEPGGQRELADYVLSKTQPWTPKVFVQGNGLGRFTGSPTTKELFRGMQMYDPGDYDWANIYRRLDGIGATYVEVYTDSFTGGRRATLATQVRNYAAKFDRFCRL
jgi:hypothetical protein